MVAETNFNFKTTYLRATQDRIDYFFRKSQINGVHAVQAFTAIKKITVIDIFKSFWSRPLLNIVENAKLVIELKLPGTLFW